MHQIHQDLELTREHSGVEEEGGSGRGLRELMWDPVLGRPEGSTTISTILPEELTQQGSSPRGFLVVVEAMGGV